MVNKRQKTLYLGMCTILRIYKNPNTIPGSSNSKSIESGIYKSKRNSMFLFISIFIYHIYPIIYEIHLLIFSNYSSMSCAILEDKKDSLYVKS